MLDNGTKGRKRLSAEEKFQIFLEIGYGIDDAVSVSASMGLLQSIFLPRSATADELTTPYRSLE